MSALHVHALVDSAKSFLSSMAVFKSIENKIAHGSKLVGDIRTYLLEAKADPLLVGLILEALEGQERAAGSGYEWSVCLAAFIVKRLIKHDAPIPDILQVMHEGLSACHDILNHSSIGSEELPSAIKEDDLKIYIKAIEHHQAGTAKAQLFLTDDLEDMGVEWFFESQEPKAVKGAQCIVSSRRIASVAMSLNRERMEMRIAAAVCSIFDTSGQGENWLNYVKIIRLLGEPIDASRVMAGSCVCLNASDQAQMDQVAPLMEEVGESLKVLLLIDGPLTLPREAEGSASIALRGIDVILCSGSASPEASTIMNVKVISNLGVSSVRGVARACGTKTLATVPWPQSRTTHSLQHLGVAARLQIKRGIHLEDSPNVDETMFLLIEPAVLFRSESGSVVVLLYSHTRAQAEASEVFVKKGIMDIEACCGRKRRSIVPGFGLQEIMFSNHLQTLSSKLEIQPDQSQDQHQPQWLQFNVRVSDDRQRLRAAVFWSIGSAFDDMACAIFQAHSSLLPLGNPSIQDACSLAALHEAFRLLAAKDGKRLNVTDIHAMQYAMSKAGGLEWSGLVVDSLSSREAGLRSGGLIAGTFLQTLSQV